MKRTPFKKKPYVWKPKPKKKPKGIFDHIKKENKVQEWSRILKELKERFVYAQILSCELRLEGCTLATNFGWTWGFAHSKKRDKISAIPEIREVEIRQVVYACGNCHDIIEDLKEEDSPNMYDVVCNTIEKRDKQP